MNVQCLRTKLNSVELFVSVNVPDVMCLSEHWLRNEESDFYKIIANLKLVDICCRTQYKNGGTAIYIKEGYKSVTLDLTQFCSELNLEITGTVLTDFNLVILSLYRSDAGEFDIFLDLLDSSLDYTTSLYANYTIVIGGDFNILLNSETTHTKRVTGILRTYGLYWSSTEPTRGSNCLDSSASNCNIWEINTQVVNPLVADHMAVVSDVLVEHNSKPATIPWLGNYSINVRKLDLSVVPLFKSSLKNIDWNFIDMTMDANMAFDLFFDKLDEIFNSYFPVKTVRPRPKQTGKPSKVGSTKEWFTDELKVFKSWVLLFYDKYKSAESFEEKDKFFRLYLNAKKRYKQELDVAKREGNSKLIKESMNPCKAAWSLINSHRKKDSTPACSASPDEVNGFFIQSVEGIVGDMDDRSAEAASNVQVPVRLEWSTWSVVSVEDIVKIVAQFRSSPSLDAYGMSTALLKEIIDVIAETLTLVFNTCLKQGIFPNKLKLARTVPVFKKGDSTDISSYRPISIVPALVKILETVMNRQLMSYFEKNDLFSFMQHGFRKNKSTITAVQVLVERVCDAFENHESALLTLCDLTKAFDCTSHKILLLKLKNYGVSGTVLLTFQSYLNERSQVVTIHGASSQTLKVAHGVPQGSVLGPLLFLIVVNDLNTVINALLYADDTTLVNTGKDAVNLFAEASNSLESAKTWFELNNLVLNEAKTQTLFCSLWTRPTQDINTGPVKLLGIHIDAKLSWNSHVDQVCTKLSRVNYLLRKLKTLVTPDFLLTTYHGLFHCHINYGIILWGHASCCNSVFLMQKIAIRVITSSERLAHCRPLFQKLGVLTVYGQYIFNCIVHLKTNAHLPERTRDKLHNHNTRGKSNLNIPQCRLSKVKDSYPVVAYRMFNKLPMEIRGLKLNQLKDRLGEWLLKKSFYSVQEFFDDPVSDI